MTFTSRRNKRQSLTLYTYIFVLCEHIFEITCRPSPKCTIIVQAPSVLRAIRYTCQLLYFMGTLVPRWLLSSFSDWLEPFRVSSDPYYYCNWAYSLKFGHFLLGFTTTIRYKEQILFFLFLVGWFSTVMPG